MSYIDFERLAAIDVGKFQRQSPYPWINPADLLTPSGYSDLSKSLPPPGMFEERIGIERKHDQPSHDRLALEWSEDLDLPEPWNDFVSELQSKEYRSWLQDMFQTRSLRLRFHWHYTFCGASVSPHCDSKYKLGSHIFYFNTEEDWQPEWGGETLVLDDGGRFNRRSAPGFEEFDSISETRAIGNRSFLFQNDGQSWHGVREIRCPKDHYRKVFIALVCSNAPIERARALIQKSRRGY